MSRETRRQLPAKPLSPLPADEDFLTGLCNTLIEAVLVADLSSRLVVYWNGGAERLFGYSAAEVLETSVERIFPEGAAFARLYQGVASETKQSGIWQREWEFRHRDGSRFRAATTATLLNGSHLTLVARESRAKTEQQATTEQLREKEYMAAISTAAAVLAHEIKNPLNGISTTVQLLERSLAKVQPTKEAIMASVRDLENEIGRLQALLGDFQTISVPQQLNFQPVDLARVAREITTVAIEECKTRKIELIAEIAADLPCVEGDPDKLKQALRNLIKNSCEAMPNGGTLTLKGYVCDHEVCLDVTDTGEGIAEGRQIFDLFTSTKPGRAGFGLLIVQQMVLAHRGSITFSGEAGQGTTFRVRLPAIKAATT
jgi:PAS domain S-box-containing protein